MRLVPPLREGNASLEIERNGEESVALRRLKRSVETRTEGENHGTRAEKLESSRETGIDLRGCGEIGFRRFSQNLGSHSVEKSPNPFDGQKVRGKRNVQGKNDRVRGAIRDGTILRARLLVLQETGEQGKQVENRVQPVRLRRRIGRGGAISLVSWSGSGSGVEALARKAFKRKLRGGAMKKAFAKISLLESNPRESWPKKWLEESLRPINQATVYFDHRSGALYVQEGGEVFSMTVKENVTDEISLTDPEMEAIKTICLDDFPDSEDEGEEGER
jgi:hypothetical protein